MCRLYPVGCYFNMYSHICEYEWGKTGCLCMYLSFYGSGAGCMFFSVVLTVTQLCICAMLRLNIFWFNCH